GASRVPPPPPHSSAPLSAPRRRHRRAASLFEEGSMSTTHRRFLARASTLGIAVAVLTASATAQQQLGAMQGTIVDQTRGVLPGVTVTVTNTDTGIRRTTTTNETGVYRVPSLDPGRYSAKAE